MRFTLHDNIHGSAGPVHPESRRPPSEAERAPWVGALRQWLARGASREGPRDGELKLRAGTLRMRVSRFGDAMAVAWTAGPDWRVVAATALLAGRDASDDESAVAELRAITPRLPFGPDDYARLSAESRPCVGTMYLDGRWFDNGGVELAATALALAAWEGAGREPAAAKEPAAPARTRPLPAQPLPAKPSPAQPFAESSPAGPSPAGPPPFTFTRERVELITGMVKKKLSAALRPEAGVHFRVYPPPEFHQHPEFLRGAGVFERLRGTTWWVRWYDGQLDRLDFGEFLAFVDQAVGVGESLLGARPPNRLVPPAPLNEAVWATGGPRRQLSVRQALDTRTLVRDERVRQLLDAVSLEPPTASHASSSSAGRAAAGR